VLGNPPEVESVMIRAVPLVVALLLLVGCAGAPVATDYDPEFPFASIRSYAWLKSASNSELPEAEPRKHGPQQAGKARAEINDLMRDRIRAALAAQMQAQGINDASSSKTADILLTFHMGIKERVEVYDFHDHFGYYPCFSLHCGPGFGYYPGGIHHDHWQTEYQQGRLIIDMISPASGKLVWRGVSERRIPWLETPEERRLFIVDTVGAVMRHFPPARNLRH
jgi:hypothetical protein